MLTRDELRLDLEEYNEDFMENALRTIELCNSLNIQYLSSDIEGNNKLLKLLYRTVVLTDEGDGFKFPFFDLASNEKMAPRVGLEPTT